MRVSLCRDIECGELRDYVVQPGDALSKLVSQLKTSAEYLAARIGQSLCSRALEEVCKPCYGTLVACNGA